MTFDLVLLDAVWFRLVFGFVIGAILGSFATMLAYRLPRRLSIVRPRSRCPQCQTTLGFRDLVPVFSWLFSYGRCRHCGAAIGARYLLIELTTSFFCALATLLIGFSPFLVLAYVLGVAAITAFCIKRVK